MILMIDNFDSFTFNIVQYITQLGYRTEVFRNNAITVKEIEKLNPTHIVISPGPGRPISAGISKDVIHYFADKLPVLGVCLGHQAIAEVYGGKIIHAKSIMHGKISAIKHQGKGVFKDIPDSFNATRYHSLAVEKESLPSDLKITAQTEDGEIMGLQHKRYPVFGVQFHPESILSEHGYDILHNFLKIL